MSVDREFGQQQGWVGHLSLWCGLLFAPSFLIDHLKTGPLAYNGLLGVYIPAAALGI
jgi:hypothetical protein